MNPDPINRPLISESVKGDSTLRSLSVRSVVTLLMVVTLCFVVGVIAIRIKDAEAMVSALKEVFIPSLTVIMIFYFTKKSPNNETKP